MTNRHTHTHAHSHRHTHRHTDTYTQTHTQTHTHRHTHRDTDTHTQTHIHTQTDTHTHTQTHTHTHTDIHTHTDTHTDTQTHTHRHPKRAKRHFLPFSLLLAFIVKLNLQRQPRRTCPSNPTTFSPAGWAPKPPISDRQWDLRSPITQSKSKQRSSLKWVQEKFL